MNEVVEEGLEAVEKGLEADNLSFRGESVLVTGGAGFLGSWVSDYLVRDGARVTCVDNFASGVEKNIAHLRGRENFNLVEHDISRPIYFDEENFDLVIHMASRASPFEFSRYPIQILKSNTGYGWLWG